MNSAQRLEEIRCIDNLAKAFRNLIHQASSVNFDPRRLIQYRNDLNEIETRMSRLIHSPDFSLTN